MHNPALAGERTAGHFSLLASKPNVFAFAQSREALGRRGLNRVEETPRCTLTEEASGLAR